jgi:acetyltransferase
VALPHAFGEVRLVKQLTSCHSAGIACAALTPPVQLRPLEPADGDRLADFFARLSPEARHRRFLGPKPILKASELRHLTDIDHRAREAIVAVDQRTGAIVGEARYARWPGREQVADVAVVVLDELQGRRIGTTLVAAVLGRARANDLTLLTASTLWENGPARALLRRAGFRPVASAGGVLELELALGALRQPRPLSTLSA